MNNSLVIVDIQPSYHDWHAHVTNRLAYHLNNSNYQNILYFFNGEEVGIDDTQYDMREYLEEWGVEEEVLNKIIFIEKSYAFFRNWLDSGIDEGFIQLVAQWMIQNGVFDSRNIQEEDLMKMFTQFYGEISDLENSVEWQNISGDDMIYIPQFNWDELKKLTSCDTCGGGKSQCLKEIEILLDVIGVPYTTLEQLVYGD